MIKYMILPNLMPPVRDGELVPDGQVLGVGDNVHADPRCWAWHRDPKSLWIPVVQEGKAKWIWFP